MLKLTQSVGLLSYTFLMQTRQDRIVVPMVDYQFDLQTGSWNILYDEDQFKNNLAILLQWSPFTTEAELLKHCDDIGGHGTKIMIYNLWHSDDGEMELDFESDLEDICVSGKGKCTAEVGSRTEVNEHHLANRLCYSLRAYLSILYLRAPDNFYIILRGRVVEYHNIANDLKFPEFIVYKPHNVEASVITAIGFLKEAPLVNIHGFNIYHKNRLILPFLHVVSYHNSRGRGVVGVLEANFIQPVHNKQDFEKTPVFQKLEFRLKQMAQEYWDHHCGLIGYHQIKKRPQATVTPHASSDLRPSGIYQPVLLGTDQNSRGVPLKRKELDHDEEPERVTRMGAIGSKTNDTMLGGDHVPTSTQLVNQKATNPIFENRRLHALCQEYEKMAEALNRKVEFLRMELDEAQHEYAHLLLESDSLENAKWQNEVVEIED